MFEYIRGEVVARTPTYVVLDAGGVGYRLLVSARTYEATPAPGAEATLLAHFDVGADQHRLFGFATREERDLFLRLIQVSGVGPKSALALLSGSSPEGILTAVAQADVAFLKSVKGVGDKIAKRIITELRAEYAQLEAVILHKGPAAGPLADAAQALVQLGSTPTEARKSVEQASERLGQDASVEELVRAALRAP